MLTVRAASANPFTAVRDGERDAVYAELLSTGPAHQVVGRSGPIGWLITGHEEVRSLLSDPRLVKGGWRYGTYAARLPQELARGAYSHMLLADGADHARLRKLMTSVFTRRRIEKLAPGIQRLTDDLLSACEGSDSVDLVSAPALPLPIGVIGEMLGIPRSRGSTSGDGRPRSSRPESTATRSARPPPPRCSPSPAT